MTMNIAVSSNKSFLKPLSVLLYSLYKHNENVDVFFINFSVEDSDLEVLRDITNKFPNCSFTSIELPEDMRKKFERTEESANTIDCLNKKRLSIETYGKVVTPCLLPKHLDRILYLDADILVTKNIEDFYYDTDLQGNSLMGFDMGGYTITPGAYFPGETRCFNAGVLLLDLNKIRSTGVLDYDKVLEYIDDSMKHTNTNFDEYIMNKVFLKDVIYGDTSKYNFPANFIRNLHSKDPVFDEKVKMLYEASILHYISYNKPWYSNSRINRFSKELWHKYYEESQSI